MELAVYNPAPAIVPTLPNADPSLPSPGMSFHITELVFIWLILICAVNTLARSRRFLFDFIGLVVLSCYVVFAVIRIRKFSWYPLRQEAAAIAVALAFILAHSWSLLMFWCGYRYRASKVTPESESKPQQRDSSSTMLKFKMALASFSMEFDFVHETNGLSNESRKMLGRK